MQEVPDTPGEASVPDLRDIRRDSANMADTLAKTSLNVDVRVVVPVLAGCGSGDDNPGITDSGSPLVAWHSECSTH